MANYLNLLTTTTSVDNKDIVEPLNAPVPIPEKIKEFFPEELYNINESSILYKFLLALLGDSGVGGMKKAFLYPRLQQALTSTHFNDLDTLFTNPFAFPRLTDEIYTLDPANELLTSDQWASVRRRDSWYKARFLDYMKGVHAGMTKEGLELLSRAATGAPAQVFERWKYLDDLVSDSPVGFPNLGNTSSRNEVVILLEKDDYNVQDQKRLSQVFGRISPANVAMTYLPASTNLIEVDINSIASSSDFFFIKRLVTGNIFSTFPDVSAKFNTWIESGVQKEAPVFAFNERQESITYPTIESASASSYHIGPFTQSQATLFAHLADPPTRLFQFTADESFLNIPVNMEMSLPWYNRTDNVNNFVVNNYYPIGYFSGNNPLVNNPNKKVFWASKEDGPGVSEYLEFDLQVNRPINMVEFEICMKPIDITIQYLDENEEWQDVVLRTDIENNDKVFYNSSATYSWQNVEISFEQVSTPKMRINFYRRPDPFPFESTGIFDWSVDVRNLRFAYIMANAESFVSDTGTDVLGNSYETELASYSAARANDGNVDTFWQSQANPSKNAVESLYFDIRDGSNPSTIDEIWLDPVTPGALMHIYYSNDSDETDWDFKLWSPISRHYILQRGNLKLPNPVTAKFIKLEFTKFVPVPYPSLYRNNLPPIRYRTHPTWVVEYIQSIEQANKVNSIKNIIQSQVVNTPETLGVSTPKMTKLTDETRKSIVDFINNQTSSSILSNYEIWKPGTVQGQDVTTDSPEIYLNDLFQQSLLATVNSFTVQGQKIVDSNIRSSQSFRQERSVQAKDLLPIVSRADRTVTETEKNFPDTWFPRVCRHGYKVIEAKREFKVAYYVAIREVKFYRRNQLSAFDDDVYFETLADDNNTEINTFINGDWRYIVPTSALQLTGSNNIPTYGWESFDGVTFSTGGNTQSSSNNNFIPILLS